ncbi:MAG: hypothetical protein GJT30_10335 [Geobacter sp.]|nr:hypothetical protein [Geobacter sp.]
MSIFLGSERGDIVTSRPAKELLSDLDLIMTEQAPYLLPAEHQALLEGITRDLREELAWQDESTLRRAALLKQLAEAPGIPELERDFSESRSMAKEYFIRRGSPLALHAFCNDSRDSLLESVIRLAEQQLGDEGLDKPDIPHAWCVTGSLGRKEATLTTTCELLLVQGKAQSSASSDWFSRMGEIVTAHLAKLGLNSSTINPASVHWRGDLAAWRERYAEQPSSAWQLLGATNLCDLRLISGSTQLAESLRTIVCANLTAHPARLQTALRSIASLPLGFDFFGRLKVEKSGNNKGKFNLLQFALLPLVLTFRVLAVKSYLPATSTMARIRQLLDEGALGVDQAGKLLRTYHEFARCALQLEVSGKGSETEGFFFEPDDLSKEEEARFKQGLESLFNLQRIIFQSIEA